MNGKWVRDGSGARVVDPPRKEIRTALICQTISRGFLTRSDRVINHIYPSPVYLHYLAGLFFFFEIVLFGALY